MKKIASNRLAHILALMILLFPLPANALSAAQKQIFDEGVDYFNAALDGTNAATDCSTGTGTTTQTVPAGTLPSFIPEPYNGAFTEGAAAHNVAPALVAAIFSEEHNLGGSETNPSTTNLTAAWANILKEYPDPNSGWAYSKQPNDGSEVWPDGNIGAGGPFQFEPTTWVNLGYDPADVQNLVTSADAAAKYLASNGGTADQPESSWTTAIYAYNHSDSYVAAVLTYYDYYNSQPGSMPSGGSTTITSTGAATCGTACTQGTSGGTQGTNPGAPTIVLDPGHAPAPATPDIDQTNKINVSDWENVPEISDMYAAAQAISAQLTKDGYNVIITKTSVEQYINLEQREVIANQANAALGVSLHSSPGSAASVNEVFYPGVGEYRLLIDGTQSPPYSDATLAQTDQADAQIMATARAAAEGQVVKTATYEQYYGGVRTEDSTPGQIQGGNILEADYFAKVPWVYNEQWQDGGKDPGGVDPVTGKTDTSGASHVAADTLTKYETGVVNGVEKIVPLNGGGTITPGAQAGGAAATTQPNTNCTSTTCTAPTGGTTATGPNAAILCEAEKYAGIYYQPAGGHGPYATFRAGCPENAITSAASTSTADNPGLCATDCSGLVSVAVDAVYNQTLGWSVSNTNGTMWGSDGGNGTDAGSADWMSIPWSEAAAGDIVTHHISDGHVEIVDHISGTTVYSFGSKETGVQTGPTTEDESYWGDGAWRYVGPGTNGQ